MGYYPDLPPRHSHRSPMEIAEDEMLAVLRGEFGGVVVQPGSLSKSTGEPDVIPPALANMLAATRPPIKVV